METTENNTATEQQNNQTSTSSSPLRWSKEEDDAVIQISEKYTKLDSPVKGVDYKSAQKSPEWQLLSKQRPLKSIQQRVSYLRKKMGKQLYQKPVKTIKAKSKVKFNIPRNQGEILIPKKEVTPPKNENGFQGLRKVRYCPICGCDQLRVEAALSIKND